MPVPSAQTVAALARALRLPAEELLERRRKAADDGECEDGDRPGPGRPIGQWDPLDLEVHPAGPSITAAGVGAARGQELPGYVPREHDRVLAEAVRQAAAGRGRIVVLATAGSIRIDRSSGRVANPRGLTTTRQLAK